MYLSELRLWNFRKYHSGETIDPKKPALLVQFNKGVNVLIGENDSGKTTIIDAIRLLLGTHSKEWCRIEDEDFARINDDTRSTKLKIEGVFRGFTDEEASHFLEWISFEEKDGASKGAADGTKDYVLSVRLVASKRDNKIIYDIHAGADPEGTRLDGEAKEFLRVAYLKPLRDAGAEMTCGKRSRLAQILASHKIFQKTKDEPHPLEGIVKKANDKVDIFFEEADGKGNLLIQKLGEFLAIFLNNDDPRTPKITIAGNELISILRSLSLILEDNSSGLGTLNLLYMAAELLLLHDSDHSGLRLSLVEELEAHLHPQAQLRLIKFFEKQAEDGEGGQFILTTHSTTLGSSIKLENLIICIDNHVYPMGPEYTALEPRNYGYLERFLDATKANLFFAKGVILVEGAAENILIPTIAQIIDRPLYEYGVSIVSADGVGFLHYAKIFQRKKGERMDIPVAIITDTDVLPIEAYTDDKASQKRQAVAKHHNKEQIIKDIGKKHEKLKTNYEAPCLTVFHSTTWTLEYEIALDPILRKELLYSILYAKKIKNSKNGEPKDVEKEKVEKSTAELIKKWKNKFKNDERKNERIAYEIYHKIMLDKKVSKAITAQIFAEKLGEKAELKASILTSSALTYLRNAIYSVTKSANDRNDHRHDEEI